VGRVATNNFKNLPKNSLGYATSELQLQVNFFADLMNYTFVECIPSLKNIYNYV
jgi:hypothetical protein